jgi:hypothetical protein
VDDTGRLVVTAFVLTGSALGVFAWRVAAVDPTQPQRLIGELRLAQAMALLLAVTGGAWLGLAVRADGEPLAGLDVTASAGVIVAAAFALVSDPRRALGVLAAAFMAHALVDVAHRPGWLAPALAPRWFTVGCAAFDVYLAALCYWARRR